MEFLLFAVAVALSVMCLRAHFRQALVDPRNLATIPSSLKLWLYSVGCTGLAYVAIALASAGQSRASLFFAMAALGTVASPAIADPVKFSAAEIADPWKRRLENFKMQLSGTVGLKLITLFGALLSSAIIASGWVGVLALAGFINTQGRAEIFRQNFKRHERFQQLDTARRIRFMQSEMRKSLSASIAYVFWIALAGVATSEIDGFSPWNWNGYLGMALGAVIGAAGISDA